MRSDETAFFEAIDAHSGIIRKVANSYCRDVDSREDLQQEITMQIWRSWSTYDPSYKMSTWIYRIALNVAISFFRKSNRYRAVEWSIENPESLAARSDEQPNDNVRQLYEIIYELDDLNRAVILLYLERFRHDEIAQALGISKTNVATKVSRIKQLLRARFKQSEARDEY